MSGDACEKCGFIERFRNNNEKEYHYKETDIKQFKFSKKIEEPINLVGTIIKIKEQVNMTNKVKSIIFSTIIKFKTLK